VGHNLVLWHNLVQHLVYVRLNTGKDYFSWNLTSSGQFTVQPMYRTLINNGYVFHHKVLWKLKFSLKIKIFVWYLLKGVVLTKDNLARRNWQDNKKCVFCVKDETIRHLFFHCRFASHLWQLLFWYFGVRPPRSIHHVLGNWLMGVD
jgi:hypothetical protein